MKLKIDKDGYRQVKLCGGAGKVKHVRICRLVAIAFHPNPENKPTVNHKDGNKLNDNKGNLEWATYSEQNKHAHSIGLKDQKGNKNNGAKLTYAKALAARVGYAGGMSINRIAERFGVNRATIEYVINRKTWVR